MCMCLCMELFVSECACIIACACMYYVHTSLNVCMNAFMHDIVCVCGTANVSCLCMSVCV